MCHGGNQLSVKKGTRKILAAETPPDIQEFEGFRKSSIIFRVKDGVKYNFLGLLDTLFGTLQTLKCSLQTAGGPSYCAPFQILSSAFIYIFTVQGRFLPSHVCATCRMLNGFERKLEAGLGAILEKELCYAGLTFSLTVKKEHVGRRNVPCVVLFEEELNY